MTAPGLCNSLPLSIGGGCGGGGGGDSCGARELECVCATAGGSLAGASSRRCVPELLRALRRFRAVSQSRGGGRGWSGGGLLFVMRPFSLLWDARADSGILPCDSL